MLSQRPQLLLSVFTSAQVSLHIVPLGHVKPQRVPSHVGMAPGGAAQALHSVRPQLSVESLLTQAPLQRCCLSGQLQRESTQRSPRGQAMSHLPQCAASVCTSTQLPPHCASVPQLKPQLVPSHVGVLPAGP